MHLKTTALVQSYTGPVVSKSKIGSSANNTLLISNFLLSTSVVADLQKHAFYLVVLDASVESESSSCNVHARCGIYIHYGIM